jgi:hypothetical protein
MKGPESQTALVPAQSTALVRKAAAKLAKRGLGDLWLLESAEDWFERAKAAKSQNQLIEFFECLQRTVVLDPEHTDGLDQLGMAYHQVMLTQSHPLRSLNDPSLSSSSNL